MSRGFRFVLILLLAGAAAAGLSRAPEALAEMEAFQAREFALEGSRFLGTEEAVRWAALPVDASVWDDPAPWEGRLRDHPLVEDVEVRRRFPHTLVFRIREKVPVALYPRPTLEPIDGTGQALPLDPSLHRLDLPVIRPRVGRSGRPLTPGELHRMAGELGRLAEAEPGFLAGVSELALDGPGDVVATLIESRVRFRFRPPLTPMRLRQGMQALEDARSVEGERAVRSVDLRYEDQVVIQLASAASHQTD